MMTLVSILTMSAISVSAKSANQQKFQAKEAYVMDAETGQVLYQKNGSTKRPIASLSKLMTLYLTKKLGTKKCRWTTNFVE